MQINKRSKAKRNCVATLARQANRSYFKNILSIFIGKRVDLKSIFSWLKNQIKVINGALIIAMAYPNSLKK